jgi:hypothetical protein
MIDRIMQKMYGVGERICYFCRFKAVELLKMGAKLNCGFVEL